MLLLIGPSSSGKSSLARAHFLPTEILSSDACRALVCDDENEQSVTADAFELLYALADKRMKYRRLSVIDATNVQPAARKGLVDLAAPHGCPLLALVLDLPEAVCLQRLEQRPDRSFGPEVVRRQRKQLRESLYALKAEGFAQVHVIKKPEQVEQLRFVRV